MSPRRLLALVLLGFASPAAAHDFWVQPSAYVVAPGAPVAITLQVGHGAERRRSPLSKRRVTRFAVVGPDGGEADMRSALQPGAGTNDGVLQLGAGTSVVVLETDSHAQSRQSAARFNAYLMDEGLTPAIAARRAAHRTEAEGSESYSRAAKALVQAGPVATEVATGAATGAATRPVGLGLEIVPGINPYASPRSSALPVQVLYQGRPLPGALVKLTDLAHDAAPVEAHRTDSGGWARFAMPRQGEWLLNVVWTRPAPATEDTDFETIFSSLSFAIPAAPDR